MKSTRNIGNILLVVAYAIILPFFIAYHVLLLPWTLYRLIIYLYGLRRIFHDVLHCIQGHPNMAYGQWECSNCSGIYLGWVFAKCPVCGFTCGYFPCEICGVAIKNPYYW